MKKLAIIAAVFVATTTLSMAAISGSLHDFSGTGWTNEICAPCHVPHNADAAGTYLWDHDTTVAGHTIYNTNGTSMENNPLAADTTSILCLSCHDGTVALDSFGGVVGGTTISGPALLGTDLTNDHPINVDLSIATPQYDTVANAQGKGVTFGTGGIVNCASCHDVHNNGGVAGSGLLRVTTTGSQLCLACHLK